MGKILTIAIPTFNRSSHLECLLSSLENELKDNLAEVEVIVLDNASTDNTNAIVRRFKDVQYLRNEENIGGDANIRKARRTGLGCYIWVLGDDEVLLAGAIRSVLARIKRGFEYIVVNYRCYRQSLKMAIGTFYSVRNDVEFIDENHALSILTVGVSFISCLIFDRRKLSELPDEIYGEWIEFALPQLVHCYYSTKSRKSRGILIGAPQLIAGHASPNIPEDVWNKVFCVGVQKIWEFLRHELGYSRNAVDAFRVDACRRFYANRLRYLVSTNARSGFISLRGFICRNYSLRERYEAGVLIWCTAGFSVLRVIVYLVSLPLGFAKQIAKLLTIKVC